MKDDVKSPTFKVCFRRGERLELVGNGSRAHYVMVSKIQWRPFWLAAQLYPQNDWTE